MLQWTQSTSPPQYQACDVGLKQSDLKPNYWLLSDQIAVRDANRIDITVQYYITSCSKISNNNGGAYCVDVFDLYVNQSDQFIADKHFYPNPLSNSMAYEKMSEIKKATDVRTFETLSILVKGKHVILAFHNYGACTTLSSVKVSYNVCPDKTLKSSLVSLQKTVAPANDIDSIQVKGNCFKDTVQISGSLYVHCDSNGEWNTTALEGRCICKEDMQNNGGKCVGNVSFTILLQKMYIDCYICYLLLSWMAFRNTEVTLSLSSISLQFEEDPLTETSAYNISLFTNTVKTLWNL